MPIAGGPRERPPDFGINQDPETREYV